MVSCAMYKRQTTRPISGRFLPFMQVLKRRLSTVRVIDCLACTIVAGAPPPESHSVPAPPPPAKQAERCPPIYPLACRIIDRGLTVPPTSAHTACGPEACFEHFKPHILPSANGLIPDMPNKQPQSISSGDSPLACSQLQDQPGSPCNASQHPPGQHERQPAEPAQSAGQEPTEALCQQRHQGGCVLIILT